MTEAIRSPEELIPLTPTVFNIMIALADCEMHGYGIMLQVEENTEGQMRMGPGTLYGAIKRMLNAGLIEESEERPDPSLDDQRRRYYKLAALGQKVLQLEARRLASQVSLIHSKNLLDGAFSGGVR